MDTFTTHYDSHLFDAGAAEEWRRFFAQAWGDLALRGPSDSCGAFRDGIVVKMVVEWSYRLLRAIP
jgi:hypothetical protein